MQAEQALRTLPLREVVARCRDETARYRRDQPYDDRFCFEIFRRAIEGRVEECWQELQGIYRDQLLAWCRRTGGSGSDVEELMALTWEKFWRNFTAAKLASAGSCAAVLRYLKMCAQCVTIDSGRAAMAAGSLDAAAVDVADERPLPGDLQAERSATEEFWQLVDATLHDRRERVLVHLTYEIGLKPAQIQAQRPDLFPSIKTVYQTTRAILDRLRRNAELRSWIEQGQAG